MATASEPRLAEARTWRRVPRPRPGSAMNRYRPLPDFYIGAHTETESLTLLTRDVGRYRSDFPLLKLVTPQESS